MSYHLVEVCERCGCRNMSPEIIPADADMFAQATVLLVRANAGPSGSGTRGCVNCNPAMDSDTFAAGRALAIWDGTSTP
jgi:hypothetical protein